MFSDENAPALTHPMRCVSFHQLMSLGDVPLCNDHHLTTKPEVSVALFVCKLLRHLQADGHQTWQEGRGGAQKKLAGPVSVATRKKRCFMARSGLWLDVRLPVTSQFMTSHCQ